MVGRFFGRGRGGRRPAAGGNRPARPFRNRLSDMKLLFFPFLGFSRTRLRQRLAGKTVLITGASFGIGACLAEALAETDARLILVARTADRLLDVKRAVEARGGRADAFPCDLTNPAAVEALLAHLHRLPAGIDVVVNNAGKSIRRPIFESLDRLHDEPELLRPGSAPPGTRPDPGRPPGARDQRVGGQRPAGVAAQVGRLPGVQDGLRPVVPVCRAGVERPRRRHHVDLPAARPHPHDRADGGVPERPGDGTGTGRPPHLPGHQLPPAVLRAVVAAAGPTRVRPPPVAVGGGDDVVGATPTRRRTCSPCSGNCTGADC
jgi:short chain dehydrogenase